MALKDYAIKEILSKTPYVQRFAIYDETEIADVLEVMGEADYNKVSSALEEGKDVVYRYLYQHDFSKGYGNDKHFSEYCQIFVDGENCGYCEDHPHREYVHLEDGRVVATGNPTLYYDVLLDRRVQRVGSLNVEYYH